MDEFTIEFEQANAGGVAQISRPADDQIEHRLRIARRGRHRLEHVDRGGLMLDALAEFAVGRTMSITACAVTRRRFSSGCKAHPANAPAGSNRGRHGGDEMSE